MQKNELRINKSFYAHGQYVTETSPGYPHKIKSHEKKIDRRKCKPVHPPAMPDAIIQNARKDKSMPVAGSIPASCMTRCLVRPFGTSPLRVPIT